MIKHEVLVDKDNVAYIHLLEGEYKGVNFNFGKVSFQEEGDGMIMSFEYDLRENATVDDTTKFEKTIGDLLLEIIEQNLRNNDILYKGGT